MYSTGCGLRRALLSLAALGVLALGAGAQELLPGAYVPAPVGLNFVNMAGGYSRGELSFDPSLPVEDGRAHITAFSLGYVRSIAIAGRSAQIAIIEPYVVGHVQGVLSGEFAEADRSGFGDLGMRGAINLLGAPAMTPQEFAARKPQTSLGASLAVIAPAGEYFPDKLINIGANRWAFKPELGLTVPLGRWQFEWYVGGWFFTTNDNYFGGKVRQQDPILSTQVHFWYTFRPGLWLALDANYWRGGRTTVNGLEHDDLQSNSRVGLTLALPVARLQSLRFTISRGAFTRIGGSFTSVGASYTYGWR
jgi:hypothetical protein